MILDGTAQMVLIGEQEESHSYGRGAFTLKYWPHVRLPEDRLEIPLV